jgi:predicted short-subunit dehydrogenase-like oxidoreductase (DUF2520 family)
VSDRPDIGIVGAGRAGMAFAIALTRRGWPVRAISSRDADRRIELRELVPGASIVRTAADVAQVADLILMAVPDDVIARVAASLGAQGGTIVAHLSGVHPADVLRSAVGSGVVVGAFHPLVAFADVARAADALEGAFVAIDGDGPAVEALIALAEGLGARPVILGGRRDPVTVKAAHHAAAVLAAGGFVALLDAIADLGRAAGMDESTALEVYGSLVGQGLRNAAALGITDALTGPVARGDPGTVRLHLEAIAAVAPDSRELYLAAARRQLAIAGRRGEPGGEATAELASLLAPGDDGGPLAPGGDGPPASREARADR